MADADARTVVMCARSLEVVVESALHLRRPVALVVLRVVALPAQVRPRVLEEEQAAAERLLHVEQRVRVRRHEARALRLLLRHRARRHRYQAVALRRAITIITLCSHV